MLLPARSRSGPSSAKVGSDSKIMSGSSDWQAEKRAFRVVIINHSSPKLCSASNEAPQPGPAGHTVPASCGQEPQKARPRLAWPGERCSPVMGWPGACGKAHSFYAHAQQPCRGPWQVMVYREEGCAHCGDQESSMFRPSQTVPDRWVPQSLLAH